MIKLITKMIFSLLIVLNTVQGKVDVIAHRGNSSEAPENTLIAFQQAIDLKADFIELDVHLTKDNIPVVTHDHVILRTTLNDYSTPISQMLKVDLTDYDVGTWFSNQYKGMQIPTLEEVLQLPFHNTGLMIEIKNDSAAEHLIVDAVAKTLIDSISLPKKLYIGSLSPQVLSHVRKKLPEQPIIAIVGTHDMLLQHRINQPEIFAIGKDLLTAGMVKDLQKEGKKVWVWTVDDREDVTNCITMNVDGVISNRPFFVSHIINEELTHDKYQLQ